MHRFVVRTLCLAVLLLFSFSAPALAQRPPGDFGVGGVIGDPSGISLKFYQRSDFSYDFLVAWDLNDFLFLNAHGLFERPLQNAPFRFFYGPGGYIGILDRGRDNDVVLGISGNFGLSYFIEQFDIFVQVTPRFNVVPSTDGDLGAGIGVRFYP